MLFPAFKAIAFRGALPRFALFVAVTVCLFHPLPAFAVDVKRIILEEQKIEGKIRRPQLVLIKADQRPSFEPMVMQSFGKKADILKNVNSSLVQSTPYDGPFRFEGKTITNYMP